MSRPEGDPVVREARQNVSAPNASEMDDDLSVIRADKRRTKDPPRPRHHARCRS